MEQDWFNDFQNIVRSDDIEKVIDNHAIRMPKSRHTKSQEDVLDVLDAVKAASPESYPYILRLMGAFHVLTADQLRLVVHMLNGGTFTSYAMDEGVTKAAVGQRWRTIVGHSPILGEMRRCATKRCRGSARTGDTG